MNWFLTATSTLLLLTVFSCRQAAEKPVTAETKDAESEATEPLEPPMDVIGTPVERVLELQESLAEIFDSDATALETPDGRLSLVRTFREKHEAEFDEACKSMNDFIGARPATRLMLRAEAGRRWLSFKTRIETATAGWTRGQKKGAAIAVQRFSCP